MCWKKGTKLLNSSLFLLNRYPFSWVSWPSSHFCRTIVYTAHYTIPSSNLHLKEMVWYKSVRGTEGRSLYDDVLLLLLTRPSWKSRLNYPLYYFWTRVSSAYLDLSRVQLSLYYFLLCSSTFLLPLLLCFPLTSTEIRRYVSCENLHTLSIQLVG